MHLLCSCFHFHSTFFVLFTFDKVVNCQALQGAQTKPGVHVNINKHSMHFYLFIEIVIFNGLLIYFKLVFMFSVQELHVGFVQSEIFQLYV